MYYVPIIEHISYNFATIFEILVIKIFNRNRFKSTKKHPAKMVVIELIIIHCIQIYFIAQYLKS